MKKRYLLLTALLLIPFSVRAADGIVIECDKTTAAPKSEVHCAIVGYAAGIGAVEGNVSVTNGTVTKAEKNICDIGSVSATEVSCADLYQTASMKAATYTIKVGESGNTTVALTNAKYATENTSNDVFVNVTPVTITINSTTPVNPDPTPVNPDPTPSNPTEPEKQEPTTPTTPTEQNSTEKEKIKNPETGAFLNTTLVLIALGCASYIAYRVAKKQKFFRL
ncbi:MAG: hypothetical protein E7159_01430 [Firmicutes bacterium]|nr:hypothetical protein [Bacillota bacterium]